MIGQLNESNQLHGIGRKIYKNTGMILEGQFVDGWLNGYARQCLVTCYRIGLFKGNYKMNGHGKKVYDDGQTYEGNWVDDAK
mmetsp:Transcript_40698/g.62112  ORF Transcript_40698/g.62112 Transcript_40698/m.62112 type:complete len:82 (-) Transcript_40698:186-431(-)